MAFTESTTGKTNGQKTACAITSVLLPRRDLIELDLVRPNLADRIRNDHPGLAPNALIARSEVDRYRVQYVRDLLIADSGELTELERQVAESLSNNEVLAENIEDNFTEDRTIGQKMSDNLASFAGSWTFLVSFGAFLAIWMAINVARGADAAFDPYPFILLNLVLSTIAAIQAPVIMMSQQRQEAKDRLRALNDYKVNLKAELEIRHLHEKIDHLLSKQWQRLTELQELQIEMLGDRRR